MALLGLGHQRHADPSAARVDAVRLARQQAAGQHGHIVLSEQRPSVGQVVAPRYRRPEVETGVGQRDIENVGEQRCDALELGTVQLAVRDDMGFVATNRFERLGGCRQTAPMRSGVSCPRPADACGE